MWDSCSDALITFNHDNFIGNVSYIVENDVILHALLNEIDQNTNVSIRNDARIEKVLLERDGLLSNAVELKTGESFSAELLVRKIIFTKQSCTNNNFIFSFLISKYQLTIICYFH